MPGLNCEKPGVVWIKSRIRQQRRWWRSVVQIKIKASVMFDNYLQQFISKTWTKNDFQASNNFQTYLQPLAVLLEEKSGLCLISSLLDSVLFTYFQMVLAGWEQVLMIFLKKPNFIVILLMKIQFSKDQFSKYKVARVGLGYY